MLVLRDHYYKLGSELPQERIDGAVALIKELSAVDSPEEWDYALNRLIKGLNTSRQSARFGFSMALTELAQELIVKKDYDLTVSSFIDRILEVIQIKVGMKGKDERAALFGRLFGLQALINSRLIFKKEFTSNEDLLKFVNCLLDLATIKSWLRETTIFTLCAFLKQCVLTKELALFILQKFNDADLNLTSEGVAIYLAIPLDLRLKVCPKVSNLKSTWKNYDPLSRGNLPTLAKALNDVGDVSDPEEPEGKSKGQNKKQKGSWSPRVHFIWDLLIAQMLEDSSDADEVPAKKRKTNKSKAKNVNVESSISLKEFWKVVVDEALFSEKSSHERKYWGFEIFEKTFLMVTSENISSIITPNLLRCLINQSSQPNRMLNKVSLKVLSFIKNECTKNPLKAPATLACLIDPNYGGCWNFDLITKSKTTESLINVLNQKPEIVNSDFLVLEQIQSLLVTTFTKSLSENPTTEELKTPNDNVQKWCLNLLLQLIRGNKMYLQKSYRWVEEILKLIITHGFFITKSKPMVSVNVRNLCVDRLSSILGDIIHVKRDGSSWSLYCINTIRALEQSDLYKPVQTLDAELAEVKQECQQLLEAVEQLKAKPSDKVYSFELLFSMVLLQIYMGDEDSFSVINELKICFENTFDDNDNSESSVVLTELILSFISKKSALLRKFSYIIWESLLCQRDENGVIRANEECLQLLFNILVSRENKEGQKGLFDDEDNFAPEGEEDEEKEEEEEEEEEEEDDDEDDSNSDEEADTTNATEVDKDTNLKLAQALGIPTGSSGEVKFEDLSSGDDDSSYESDSMDDDEMMAMDDQLSKIFKERRDILSNTETGNKRKTEVAEAREQMVFFKHRVLDLLEIFIRAQPDSHLTFLMIKPIIIVIDLTLDKNIGSKAHKLLKTKLSKIKLTDLKDIKSKSDRKKFLASLVELIHWLHDQFVNVKSNSSHALACNNGSILVAKNLVSLDEKYLEQVIDIYASTMKSWALNTKTKSQPSLFFDFINWLNSRKH